MRRMLTGLLALVLIAGTALSAATATELRAPLAGTQAQATITHAAAQTAMHVDVERTLRVLDQFTAPPVHLAACNNSCRQDCARAHAACMGYGGRPSDCARRRSSCLSSCGC